MLHQVLKDADLSAAEKGALAVDFDAVLGLQLAQEFQKAPTTSSIDESLIERLLLERVEARANKDFAKSDAIRDQFDIMDIVIKDSPQGTTWELK